MFKAPNESPWYEDGIESDEQCWRLEPMHDVQVQLFAAVVQDNDDESKIQYDSPTLFMDVDRRELGNPGNRIHYACAGRHPISEATAAKLLGMGDDEVKSHLAAEIAALLKLPNDPNYTGTADEQRAKFKS